MPPRKTTGSWPITRVGELVQVRGPVGGDEAVPALGQRGCRVRDDLPSPRMVCDQVLVNDGDAARLGKVVISGLAVTGGFRWSTGTRRPSADDAAGSGRPVSDQAGML
jgi:hypothetical protein